jgi:hypothetical protein
MKLKVSLPEDEVVAACQNYIEDKLMLQGPGWKIECTNSYAFSRALEFDVEAPKAEARDEAP